mgnify:CR=1 FL=1
MKLFLDTSSVDVVRDHLSTGLIDGVTTNPSLMLKEGKDPHEVIKRMSDLFDESASISAEVTADTAEEMVDLAQPYINIGSNVTIKVPCNKEGLKACLEIAETGVDVNVTLIFSVSQAILAVNSGAKYLSPFVGRVYDQSFDGIKLIEEISDVYATHNAKTQVLAASIRDVHQVSSAFRVGADICTIPPNIFAGMYKHILTDKGLEKFDQDWQKLVGG